MLLDEVKPLLILWLPIKTNWLSALHDTSFLSPAEQGGTWRNIVDFVVRRSVQNQDSNLIVARIPIPFYFYERLTANKDDTDLSTGFLLDNISESIDMEYPDVPTVIEGIQDDMQPKQMARVKNTIEASIKVKTGSTLVSVLRCLLKRVLTDVTTAKDLRVSFYWREYAISHARILDYNEAPVGNTNLVLIKLKMATYRSEETNMTQNDATKIDEKQYMSNFRNVSNVDKGGL